MPRFFEWVLNSTFVLIQILIYNKTFIYHIVIFLSPWSVAHRSPENPNGSTFIIFYE